MKPRAQEPADPRYLYEHIYLELKQEILSGKYRTGDWFPPERVLKDRFDTTHLTVRNALAKLVLEGYIERYSGKGTVVIYSGESAEVPAAPRKRKSLRFPWAHVILEDLEEYNAALLERLEAQLRKVPLAVRISCHGGDVLLEQGLRREAERSGALVILAPARSGMEAGENGTALLIGSTDAAGAGPRIIVDDAEGARAAAALFAQRGQGNAALLVSTPPRPGLRRGFLEELARRGLDPDPSRVVSCPPGVEGGQEAARALLASGIRALLCSSDETAAGALTAARGAGLAVPAEASVAGFGDTRLARALGLTSVDPGTDRLAGHVLTLVLAAVSEGALPAQRFTVSPRIRVRDT